MIERNADLSNREITKPSLRIQTELGMGLDDVSRKYYLEVMKTLDKVILMSKDCEEVGGVIRFSGKIPINSTGLSTGINSVFNKRFFQTLDLNIIFSEDGRSIELLGKDVGVFFEFDEKKQTCKKVQKGKLSDGKWYKMDTDEIPLKDALLLARLGEKF